ncbi:hypothetical protein Tco_0926257 [Tanacetum coccineum]|uniref:Uncharacterized protein n=1 Tax=Tanacetum coccineum TaxID=301880 RepID=A0ABQ5DB92_9ASTR
MALIITFQTRAFKKRLLIKSVHTVTPNQQEMIFISSRPQVWEHRLQTIWQYSDISKVLLVLEKAVSDISLPKLHTSPFHSTNVKLKNGISKGTTGKQEEGLEAKPQELGMMNYTFPEVQKTLIPKAFSDDMSMPNALILAKALLRITVS